MIKWLKVESFKNLASVEAEFNPFNVIIGPNGSGKSSLLQAIDFLRAFFEPSIDVYLNRKNIAYEDLPNLRRPGKKITWTLKAELPPDSSGQCAGTYEYAVSARRWRYLGVGQERLLFSGAKGEKQTLIDRKGRRLRVFGGYEAREDVLLARLPSSVMTQFPPHWRKKLPQAFHFRDWVERFRSFEIWNPKVLRQRERGKHVVVGESGEYLAPVLAGLKRNRPKQFQKLVTRVKHLFPTVSDIEVTGGGRGWGWKEVNLLERNGKTVRFNSRQMADGVLRLLAISTFLYSDWVPSIVTFEEPEDGIHPQLIEEVVAMLRELTLRKPPRQCQVFFTTHSPYVLDYFLDHPEEVYVMERGRPQEGASLIRLSDRKDIDLVSEAFSESLGEAWFTGLIGGNARRRAPNG